MSKFRVPLLIGVMGLALMFVACGGGDSEDDGDETAEPTETMAATEEPMENGDGDMAEGTVQGMPVAEFFQANCSTCHGEDRAGISGLGLPLLPDALTEDDAFYIDTILHGRDGTVMPKWSETIGLTEEDAATIVAFLRTEPE
jgi:mono/diheme cytochrome c family protein